MQTWAALVFVFLWSSVKFTFGVIIAFATVKSALHGFLASVVGACCGIAFFTYGEYWLENKVRGLMRRKRVFSKTTRTIIKLKQRGGLAWIAFLTPVLLSIPIGCLAATTIERDRKKIILYLSASVLFWGIVYFGLKLLLGITPIEYLWG